MAAEQLAEKYRQLRRRLAGLKQVAVAFSGGADSSFLWYAARAVLGDGALAIHAASPMQAPGEPENACRVAAAIGGSLLVRQLDPLSWPEVAANPPERCYFCKKRIYTDFLAAAAEHGMVTLLDGTNLDDLSDHRPGLRAVRELGVLTPLADAGLRKGEVRQLSRQCSLSTWDRPSSSCLATRFASDHPLTLPGLTQVARCEEFLHSLGFVGCRVRHRGDWGRIEVRPVDFSRLGQEKYWRQVEKFCREAGFRHLRREIRPAAGVL